MDLFALLGIGRLERSMLLRSIRREGLTAAAAFSLPDRHGWPLAMARKHEHNGNKREE
jgi:hypothetical protein